VSETNEVNSTELLCPTWYAIGAFAACPLLAVMFIFAAVLLVASWPVMPFFLWFHRRDEIRRHNKNMSSGI